MQNRKILTLEEVLNLNRRPTLQEMVDLSIEDYTKYLYEKGIIKYIPESGDLWDYNDDDDYFPGYDPVLRIKEHDFYSNFDDEDYKSTEQIYEELDDTIDKGYLYVNNEKYYYNIYNDCGIQIFQINSNGKRAIREVSQIYYLKLNDII